MRTRSLYCSILLLLLIFSITSGVFAESSTDTAGNFFADSDVTLPDTIERDILMVGETVTISGTAVENDVLAFGATLVMNDLNVGGDIRGAARDITVSNSSVENNISVAAYTINIDQDTNAKGIFAFAYSVVFNGTADSLIGAANSIVFGGKVNGDVYLSSNDITISPDAVISGELTISSEKMPDIPESASIGSVTFEQTASSGEGVNGEVAGESASKSLPAKLLSGLVSIIGIVLVACFIALLIPGTLVDAGNMLKSKALVMLLTGFIAILALPFFLVVLVITQIGAPIAGLLTLLSLVAVFFALPFCAASIASMVLPNIGKLPVAVIGTVIFALLQKIPYLGALLVFLCIIFTLGYYIQTIFSRLKGVKKIETAVEETAVVAMPVAETQLVEEIVAELDIQPIEEEQSDENNAELPDPDGSKPEEENPQ